MSPCLINYSIVILHLSTKCSILYLSTKCSILSLPCPQKMHILCFCPSHYLLSPTRFPHLCLILSFLFFSFFFRDTWIYSLLICLWTFFYRKRFIETILWTFFSIEYIFSIEECPKNSFNKTTFSNSSIAAILYPFLIIPHFLFQIFVFPFLFSFQYLFTHLVSSFSFALLSYLSHSLLAFNFFIILS